MDQPRRQYHCLPRITLANGTDPRFGTTAAWAPPGAGTNSDKAVFRRPQDVPLNHGAATIRTSGDRLPLSSVDRFLTGSKYPQEDYESCTQYTDALYAFQSLIPLEECEDHP